VDFSQNMAKIGCSQQPSCGGTFDICHVGHMSHVPVGTL